MPRALSISVAAASMAILAGCAGTPQSVDFRGKPLDAAQLADWQSTARMGGPPRPAQSAYDVQHYDLHVAVFPGEKRVEGRNGITVSVVAPMDVFEIPLDSRLSVVSVSVDGVSLRVFAHAEGLVRIPLAAPWQPGEEHLVSIAYGGRPFGALAPPWKDGFVWSQSADGHPWFGTTSQGSGGDLWWPVKDHPGDEPDRGMRITLDVPAGLVGLANGRKVAEREEAGRNVTEWVVHYPINQYGVAINGGPFVPLETTYTRLDGRQETIVFWALPEHAEKARAMWLDQGPRILSAFAARFGEYPFWDDKYWVVETPYLGMEHQTIVAYGSKFEIDEFGMDWLLLHETAHEWWGNKVSAADWADWWLHEGFGAYAHGVFVDVDAGRERYLEYMRKRCNAEAFARYVNPVIRGTDQVAEEAYVPEVYSKASCMLHSLRWLLGDGDFYRVLYRFLNDDHLAYHTAGTADFRRLVTEVSGTPYDWFFDRYLYDTRVPRWRMERIPESGSDLLRLGWDDPVFQLPIPVRVGEETHRVDMAGGQGSLRVPRGAEARVDPEGWLLALPAR
jgi:aminopeptidase N